MAQLISFDIDGTLEVGDPPGLITLHMVRKARERGYLIGSCSDRVISVQQQLWQQYDIPVDFTVLKHRLAEIKRGFQAEVYYHIGDTDTDRYYAEQAGFRFIWAEASALWSHGPQLFHEFLEPH